MVIHCGSEAGVIAVATLFIRLGAGFHVRTREIFQEYPIIETGDDMWGKVEDFDRANPHHGLYFRMGDA